MKKLIMRIRGGLGNQLFILGYGLVLADKSKDEVQLICDKREYEYYKVRNYELDELKVSDLLGDYETSACKKGRKYDFLIKIFHLRLFLYRRLKLKESNSGTIEKALGFIYKLRTMNIGEFHSDEIFMYGYFGDAKSLLEIRNKLRYLYEIKDASKIEKYVEKIKGAKHSIAISMRLGQDYIDAKWPICDINYYRSAIEYLKKDNSMFFVFSDDIEKAKSILKDFSCVYISGCSAAEQLSLMSKCDDYIISDSTFSWWGAFLGQKEDRVICCPAYWHTRETTSSRLYYKNMHIVQQKEGKDLC